MFSWLKSNSYCIIYVNVGLLLNPYPKYRFTQGCTSFANVIESASLTSSTTYKDVERLLGIFISNKPVHKLRCVARPIPKNARGVAIHLVVKNSAVNLLH